MPEKRKDSKGRVLKDGESQRANGTYDYRYTDIHKKRRCIYAKSLIELRKKEEELWRDLADGIDYAAGEMTVADLVDRYMNLKRGLKPNSLRSYNTAVKRIHADPFGQKAIKTVKLSDAKGWFVFLHDSGFKQNTIGILQSVIRPAFEMAVEDDIIRKNPFKFKLSDVVPKDAYVRNALTREQQEKYLQFVQDYGGNYYDDIVILMGTGLRVSELYGLTRADIDFERHCIHVRRQLCRTAEKPYFVTPPKTKSGIRNVPMTDTVCAALRRVVKARASTKVEALVDGCSGFLFLDKSGMPKVAMHLENYMRGVQGKFEKAYSKPVPRITPHVLRHTFCTNVQQAGPGTLVWLCSALPPGLHRLCWSKARTACTAPLQSQAAVIHIAPAPDGPTSKAPSPVPYPVTVWTEKKGCIRQALKERRKRGGTSEETPPQKCA